MINPTGIVVAVVCAIALEAITASDSAKAAAIERVHMEECVIEGGRVEGLWSLSSVYARGKMINYDSQCLAGLCVFSEACRIGNRQ